MGAKIYRNLTNKQIIKILFIFSVRSRRQRRRSSRSSSSRPRLRRRDLEDDPIVSSCSQLKKMRIVCLQFKTEKQNLEDDPVVRFIVSEIDEE